MKYAWILFYFSYILKYILDPKDSIHFIQQQVMLPVGF